MSSKVNIIVVDDLDGTEGAEPVRVALDGVAYEVDLAPHNQAALREAMGPFLERARRTRRHDTRAHRPGRPNRNPDTPHIRQWALGNGYKVGDRGRIPGPVLAAYHAAHAS